MSGQLLSPKAEIVYQELVTIVLKIEQKRKDGWLLLDKHKNVVTGKFVFSTPFDDKCIAFKYGENTYGCLIDYGKCHIYGGASFLEECRAAKKSLRDYKLFEPKKIYNIWEL